MKAMFLYGLAFFLINHSFYAMQDNSLFDATCNRFIDGIDQFLSNKISYNQCVDYAQEFKKYKHEPEYGSKVSFIKKYVNDLPESYRKSIQLKDLQMWLNTLTAAFTISTTLLMLAVEYIDPNIAPKNTLSVSGMVTFFPGYNYVTERQERSEIYASLKKYHHSKDQLDRLIQDLERKKIIAEL